METVKKRSEMDPKYQWRLTDIFADEAAYNEAFAQAEELVGAVAQGQGRVAEDPAKAITASFRVREKLEKLLSFVMMKKDEDNGNTHSQAEMQRAMSLAIKAETVGAYLQPELLAMPEDELKALMDKPEMKEYRVFLSDLLREKPHTLSAAEERILAMTGDMAQGPDDIYSMLTDVDLKFDAVKDGEGNDVALTDSGYGKIIHCADRTLRANAFHTLFSTYGAFGNTIAGTYGASVKKDCFYAKVRNHASALEASLFPDQIPVAVYDNLVSAVHEALPALNKYLAVRKKATGTEELHLYDLYVPIAGDFDMNLPYEEAYQLVMEGLAPHGEDYVAILKQAHDEGWLDVYENENKTGGAYSNGVHAVHPYVLLNHHDNLDSAMTIAHELGHAMHSWFSDHAQPFATCDYSLFVAEVASTTNEIIVMRHLLNKYKDDKKAVRFLLNHYLEQFRTTVFRQTMFAEFERKVHEMWEQGIPLTNESMGDVYYELNKQYYGESCVVDEEIRNEWMRIPHFYRAFYVYKYATGFSAAVFLANRILTEGEKAVKDYRKFLSAGCSVSPLDALRLAGLDMANPQPVKDALNEFARTVDTFTEMF